MERTISSRPPMTPSAFGSSSVKSGIASASKSSNNVSRSVDESTFLENFEKVPTLQIYSARDVEDHLKKFHDILTNKNEDWENRVDCLKKIRSIVIAGALKYEEFYESLLKLQHTFQGAIDDLRSLVVREACFTVAFLSKTLENKLERFCEAVLPNLINLVQKSQKIFASSGIVCIRFILQYTHGSRLIPIITNSLNSRSKDVRKACCEYVHIILKTWHTHTLERQLTNIKEAIKKGIKDGDAEARCHSRNAFAEFAHHFPDQAESLKNSLELIYRKQLECGSNSGSSSSLNKYATAKIVRTNASNTGSMRSTSAIDLQAAKRAGTRAKFAAEDRQKLRVGSATKMKPTTPSGLSTPSVADSRSGRTQNRVSISQPSSRSGSPSSRYNSYSHFLANTGSPLSRSRKGSIGNNTSRETSPGRSLTSPFGIKRSTQPVRRPLVSQRMLQQSREAENELADALDNISDLSGHYFRPASSKGVFRTPDDHSDESETSSISSDHSFNAYRRPSDSMSWNGSQNRLYRDMGEPLLKNVADIIACCENSQWNTRRKGLESLQDYLRNGNQLDLVDLKRLMDIFLRIFNDPHVKLFSLFLDTLNELIRHYSMDLLYCLRLLLTRLFNKLGSGTHLLDTVHSKIVATLDNVFESFPYDLQMQSVFNFLIDPTQTPNNRVKVAALNYLVRLTTRDDSRSALTSNGAKDYATTALTKIISWTMSDNIKSNPELRRASRDAIASLFDLDPNQVTKIFTSMPSDYQEIAQAICKGTCSPRKTLESSSACLNCSIDVNVSNSPPVAKFNDKPDKSYKVFAKYLSNGKNSISDHRESTNSSPLETNCDMTDSQIKNSLTTLFACLEKLSHVSDKIPEKRETLLELSKIIQDCPSDAMITHFKLLLSRIVLLMSPSEPACIKELVLNLLQTIVKRRTVNFLVKESSVLIITRVITLFADRGRDAARVDGDFKDVVTSESDPNKEVTKAAESCAMVLSTHLPAEEVVKTVVPLISTSEMTPVKLISIKMLTRLVENSDSTVFLENINQIMSVLLIAYDDPESAVRKAAVFCMVALYKHSEEMKNALIPYIEKLPNAKKKLLLLYIQRAEHGSHNSSMPTSPRNA